MPLRSWAPRPVGSFARYDHVGHPVYGQAMAGSPLRNKSDITPGRVIYVPSIFYNGRDEMVVVSESLASTALGMTVLLVYAGDDRGCWAATKWMNAHKEAGNTMWRAKEHL